MVLAALKKKKPVKSIREQTPEEQMYLLKVGAHQILGEKWIHYKKIKMAGSSGKLFKSKDLTDEMKATQSALKFTSKNATRLYQVAYQTALGEIKKYTDSTEGFPELDADTSAALTSEFDAVIIAYTPIKFLLPAKQIREKGIASERHSEGLVAKLYFKVAAFYTNPLNWNSQTLGFYMSKLDKDSTYQEVVMALEPLKKDLLSFSEQYELFKFGKAALSKDVTSDADAFDDAMADESFEAQVRTLYWHRFIYEALELFLFRYYLTLVTSTASTSAMRYLTAIFEPALKQAIENRMIFAGSFDTDISRRQFQKPFEIYRRERLNDAVRKKIQTQNGVFEIFNYNLSLLRKAGLRHHLEKVPVNGSQWWKFTRNYILGIDRPVAVNSDTEKELSPEAEEEEVQQKQELIELTKEKKQIEEEFNDADDQLGELNIQMSVLNPPKKEHELAEKRKALEMEKKDVEIRLVKLEAEKNRLTDREQHVNQEEEGFYLKSADLNEKQKGLDEEAKTLESAKAGALKDQEKINNEEEKLDKEEKEQFEIDKKLDDRISELTTQKADADVGDLIQKEITETQKEKKGIAENKKRIEKEKQNLFKIQAENKELLERLEQDAKKSADEQVKLKTEMENHQAEAKGAGDYQNQLADIHAEMHGIDVELMEKRKQMARFESREAKINKNQALLKEKAKKLEDAIAKAEKNMQGPIKRKQEIDSKIEEIQGVQRQKLETQKKAEEEARAKLGDLNSSETRYTSLVHIITTIIKCARFEKTAKSEIMKRFEARMAQDQELANTRITEIKKESDKKIREMTRRIAKLKRMEQEGAAGNFERDLETFKQKTEKKGESILRNSKAVAEIQRKRLGRLQEQIEIEKSQSDARGVVNLIELISQASPGGNFQKEFKNFVLRFVSGQYIRELETFYHYLFEILGASILDKVALVQSLQKSAGGTVPLSLSESDLDSFGVIVRNMKEKINEITPFIFESSVSLYSSNVKIGDMLNLKLDNRSLQKLLGLKVSSSKNPKQAKLEAMVVKSLLDLNDVMNPVPFYNLLQPGAENEPDPLKAIDVSLLTKLVTESKSKSA
jgi:hypothetical protein